MTTHYTQPAGRPAPRARRGFTFVEILIAMSLMLVIIGLSTKLFRNQSSAVATQAGRLDAQQNSRFALSMLDREIRVAGVGIADAQPLVVQAAPLAFTFNADLAALDTADPGAVYINPDADSAAVSVLRKADRITLPTSTKQYPDTTYQLNVGVPSNAETISYWLSRDSTSSSSTEYILFRRVNAQPVRVVAKGIIVGARDTVFQYFKSDTTGALTPVPLAALPIIHSAAIHGSPADTGNSARSDSIKVVKITLTSVYHDPRTGKDALRTMRTTVHMMNAMLIRQSSCGEPPLAVGKPAGVVTPADGITVPQTFVTVTWSASVDDGTGEKDVERYAIYRRLVSETDFDKQPLTSVPASASGSYSFVDTDVQSGQSYVYGVSAQDCTPSSSAIAASDPVVIP